MREMHREKCLGRFRRVGAAHAGLARQRERPRAHSPQGWTTMTLSASVQQPLGTTYTRCKSHRIGHRHRLSGHLYAGVHNLARCLLLQLRRAGLNPVLDVRVLDSLRRPLFTGPKGVSSSFGWFTANLSLEEPYYFKGVGSPVLPLNSCSFDLLTLAVRS